MGKGSPSAVVVAVLFYGFPSSSDKVGTLPPVTSLLLLRRYPPSADPIAYILHISGHILV